MAKIHKKYSYKQTFLNFFIKKFKIPDFDANYFLKNKNIYIIIKPKNFVLLPIIELTDRI